MQSVTVHYCYVVQVSDCDYQSQSHSLTPHYLGEPTPIRDYTVLYKLYHEHQPHDINTVKMIWFSEPYHFHCIYVMWLMFMVQFVQYCVVSNWCHAICANCAHSACRQLTYAYRASSMPLCGSYNISYYHSVVTFVTKLHSSLQLVMLSYPVLHRIIRSILLVYLYKIQICLRL